MLSLLIGIEISEKDVCFKTKVVCENLVRFFRNILIFVEIHLLQNLDAIFSSGIILFDLHLEEMDFFCVHYYLLKHVVDDVEADHGDAFSKSCFADQI